MSGVSSLFPPNVQDLFHPLFCTTDSSSRGFLHKNRNEFWRWSSSHTDGSKWHQRRQNSRRLLINFRFMILHRKTFPCLCLAKHFYVFSFMWKAEANTSCFPYTFAAINDKLLQDVSCRYGANRKIGKENMMSRVIIFTIIDISCFCSPQKPKWNWRRNAVNIFLNFISSPELCRFE